MAERTRQKLERGVLVGGVIERLHTDGRGVMTALNGAGDEKDVVVRGAWPGDEIDAQIRTKRKGRVEAETVAVIRRATPRRRPPCLHVWECGGCRWQHWQHVDQLVQKRRLVEDAFTAEMPGREPEVRDTLRVSDEFAYRNKMEFTFGRVKFGPDAGQLVLGLHRSGRFDWVFDVVSCHLASEPVNRVLSWVRDWAKRHRLTPYDQRRHDGLLRHLVVREARTTGEVMVNLVVARDDFAALDDFATELTEAVPTVASVLVSVNTRRGDTAIAESTRVLAGKPTITERIGDIEIELSPESFVQTNTIGAARLYDIAAERAGLTGDERVLDLYCGTGLIGLWVRDQAREVVGVESVPEAVADAARLRDRLDANAVRFVTGLAEDELPKWTVSGEQFDVAFVDPPRMGVHPKALTALVELAPRRIVYVSCNPRSLARDVATLCDAGYVPGSIQPVDMFPQTAHVECVTVLNRA